MATISIFSIRLGRLLLTCGRGAAVGYDRSKMTVQRS
jgi:hypothetical protein